MNMKIRRTKYLISSAIFDLVSKNDIKDVSVQMIIDLAKITRPTFYNHYPDVLHAVRATAISMMDEAMPPLPPAGDTMPTPEEFWAKTQSQIMPILEHIAERRPFYRRVLRQAADLSYFEDAMAMFISKTDPSLLRIAETADTPAQADMIEILTNGMMWLAIRWLLGSEEVPPQELGRRMTDAILAILAIKSMDGPWTAASPASH